MAYFNQVRLSSVQLAVCLYYAATPPLVRLDSVLVCCKLTQLPDVQANKSAIIQGKEGTYPAITAEQFVREQLAAIYVKAEA